MAPAIVPGIYDADVADEALLISTEEGFKFARRLAREAGIAVGPSGGANARTPDEAVMDRED